MKPIGKMKYMHSDGRGVTVLVSRGDTGLLIATSKDIPALMVIGVQSYPERLANDVKRTLETTEFPDPRNPGAEATA